MSNLGNLRIIILEDDKSISQLFKTLFACHGCQVQFFSNPELFNCCALSESQCPLGSPCNDVLITDNMMPKMKGIELLSLLEQKNCKILNSNKALMSSSATSELLSEIDRLDCNFFKKPLSLSTVVKWLNACSERLRFP
jgi:CheY-like chemotaxis protein